MLNMDYQLVCKYEHNVDQNSFTWNYSHAEQFPQPEGEIPVFAGEVSSPFITVCEMKNGRLLTPNGVFIFGPKDAKDLDLHMQRMASSNQPVQQIVSVFKRDNVYILSFVYFLKQTGQHIDSVTKIVNPARIQKDAISTLQAALRRLTEPKSHAKKRAKKDARKFLRRLMMRRIIRAYWLRERAILGAREFLTRLMMRRTDRAYWLKNRHLVAK